MSRTFGWVQDGGSFRNLKRVLLAIMPDSSYNAHLRETMIPRYVPERYGRKKLINAISGDNCSHIPYDLIKGKGSSFQLTVAENVEMFGYSEDEAFKVVRGGKRGNAACTGIAQIAALAQKTLPNGEKKPYQGDWSADSFARWGISLGFIKYDLRNDSCAISDLGRRFAVSENDSDEEKTVIEEALMSYPPACRVLGLLAEQGHLTKFEIGRQLGFVGEAGFTSLSQSLYVGGISTAVTNEEKNDIRQNHEGSSDKYARMIAGWLEHIGWAAKRPKKVTESYLGADYTVSIGQSYEITQRGMKNLNRIWGGSRHRRPPKIVLWNMLATAAPDNDYLRNRRCHILQAIKHGKTVGEVRDYLHKKGFDVSSATIKDDIDNFINIGLIIDESNERYLLKDIIIGLEIPDIATTVKRSDLSVIKEQIRERLLTVNHRYLALLDLSYNSISNREFEIETMSLFVDELSYQGLHLGGSRKPDGLFYKGENGIIVDTKAYSGGYSLPMSQADEMIRYIEENKLRGGININHWWDNFGDDVNTFSYLFVSSEFTGQFAERIQHIKDRTDYDGGVISVQSLLLFAERVLSGQVSYSDSFRLLRINREIRI